MADTYEQTVLEVARALYYIDTMSEASNDDVALDAWGAEARAAVQTMQRLGWEAGQNAT